MEPGRGIASNTGTVVWGLAVVVPWDWELLTTHLHVRSSWEPVSVKIDVPKGANWHAVRGHEPPGTTSEIRGVDSGDLATAKPSDLAHLRRAIPLAQTSA